MGQSRVSCGVQFGALALLALSLAGCGARDQSTLKALSVASIDDVINGITLEPIKTNLYYLASDELQGRGSGAPGGEKAAQFIAKKFEESGLKPGFSTGYFQKFSVNAGTTSNVVGYFPGNDAELKKQVIVIGAHYDHLGMRNSLLGNDNNNEGDDPPRPVIYYGADDNASGSTVVLEAAKSLSLIKDQLKRTVVLIAFSGEELGLVGSNYYVKKPAFPMADTIYMLNLDMVGYLRNGDLNLLGGGSSQSAAAAMKEICAKYPEIVPDITESAGGGSDHVPFMQKNIPGVFFHTGSHPNYHKPTDTPDKINYKGLTTIAKIAVELAWRISEKPAVPADTRRDIEITDRDLRYDHDMTPFPEIH